MAKAPVAGTVKTRLRLQPEAAARLQEALLGDAVEKAREAAPVTVAVSPADGLSEVRSLVGPEVPLLPQPDGSLGDRMLAGVRELSAGGGIVVVLGTDAPTLPPAYIREAIGALDSGYDATLTPSEDGGYVLIGLREPYAELFGDITWSTPEVYRQTLDAARGAGLAVYETAPWHDVDEPEDLERLRGELARDPGLAPRTARLLAEVRPGC